MAARVGIRNATAIAIARRFPVKSAIDARAMMSAVAIASSEGAVKNPESGDAIPFSHEQTALSTAITRSRSVTRATQNAAPVTSITKMIGVIAIVATDPPRANWWKW